MAPKQPRRRKPFKVVRDVKLGTEVEVFVNGDGEFYADVLGMPLKAAVCADLERAIYDRCRGLHNPEWVDVVTVEEVEPFGSSRGTSAAFFGLTLRRFHVYLRADGAVMATEGWMPGVPSVERVRESRWRKLDAPFALPIVIVDGGGAQETWLAHSEETWAALLLVKEKLDALKDQFRALVGTGEGAARLADLGRAQLAAPPPTEAEHRRRIAREARVRGIANPVAVWRHDDGGTVGWLVDTFRDDGTPSTRYYATQWENFRYMMDFERGERMRDVPRPDGAVMTPLDVAGVGDGVRGLLG